MIFVYQHIINLAKKIFLSISRNFYHIAYYDYLSFFKLEHVLECINCELKDSQEKKQLNFE